MLDELAVVPTPDRRVEVARARLHLARLRTRERLQALRVEVAEKTSWEAWYQTSPVPFLAAAFLVGFLLARRR